MLYYALIFLLIGCSGGPWLLRRSGHRVLNRLGTVSRGHYSVSGASDNGWMSF
jgi:hypothetical protein